MAKKRSKFPQVPKPVGKKQKAAFFGPEMLVTGPVGAGIGVGLFVGARKVAKHIEEKRFQKIKKRKGKLTPKQRKELKSLVSSGRRQAAEFSGIGKLAEKGIRAKKRIKRLIRGK